MGSKASRFEALDSWRGICAMAVAFFHFPIAGAVRFFPPVAHAYLFVDFFFVLSGFVIATSSMESLSHPGHTGRFLLRRFGRIWPLHITMLAAFVAFSIVKGDIGVNERHSYEAIGTNILLIHGLGIHHDLTWNGPSWSISVEAALYVLFALVMMLPRRLPVFAALAVVGWASLAFWAPNGMASTFDFGVCRGLAGFFVGVLLTRAPAMKLGTWAEAGAVVAVAIFVSLNLWTLLAPAIFGTAVYVFAHSEGAISRALRAKPLLFLGERSYSTYMVHAALVSVIWTLAPHLGLVRDGVFLHGSAAIMWETAAVYVVAIVGVATLTYRFIECPARRWFNGLAARPALATAAE